MAARQRAGSARVPPRGHGTGRSTSRSIRQGAINLILNAEPDSFARLHFADHGPSVCAIGVATDDSVRALNRATALQCPRFDSRLGPNELTIPAVRTPGGSLVYFVPATVGSGAMFETDFDLATAAPQANEAGAGLTRVDHVAMALPVEALDTWILFCRAVLGMETGESLELSDPFGLVRSCGVATPDRAVRMVLNVSQSRSTQMARAIAVQGGASVHHIAFATDDIFATMARLADNGARFVAISPNYYDDLAARFDLAPDSVARMRERGDRLRAHVRGRLLSCVFTKLRRSLLLRDRPARRRVRRLRRAERAGATGRAAAASAVVTPATRRPTDFPGNP